jgi:hypothetical protein
MKFRELVNWRIGLWIFFTALRPLLCPRSRVRSLSRTCTNCIIAYKWVRWSFRASPDVFASLFGPLLTDYGVSFPGCFTTRGTTAREDQRASEPSHVHKFVVSAELEGAHRRGPAAHTCRNPREPVASLLEGTLKFLPRFLVNEIEIFLSQILAVLYRGQASRRTVVSFGLWWTWLRSVNILDYTELLGG